MDNKQIVIGFFLVVLLGLFASNTFSVVQGFTVTSVSVDTPIISDSTNLKNVKYIVNTVFDGGGQSISGRVTPFDISQKSDHESQYDFVLSATALDENIAYPIKNTGQGVYKYSMKTVEVGGCSGAEYIFDYKASIFLPVSKQICVYKKLDAVIGTLDNPTVRNTAKISVSSTKNPTEIFTKTIDTVTQKSIYFDKNGQRLVDASWTGSLVSGNPYPSPADYVATYPVETSGWSYKGTWRLSPSYELLNYKTVDATAMGRFQDWQDFPNDFSCEGLTACQDIIQSEIDRVYGASSALVGGSATTIGSAQTYLDRDDKNQGKVQITLKDRKVNYMNVLFKISADWIGINIPVGKPNILSVNCPTFSSGDSSGLCEITVKNTGSGAGTFEASVTNAGVFSQKYTSQPLTFDVGETDIMRVYIDAGNTATDTVSTALFTVYDKNDGSIKDTMTATITMTAPKTCVPNELRISGLNIYKCKQDGSGENIILSCGSDDVLKKGTDLGDGLEGWSCTQVTGKDTGGLGNILDSIFGDGGVTVNTILIAVLIIAFAAIGLLMAYGIIKAVILKKIT